MKLESIKAIKDFKSLAYFLAEELAWPIDPDSVDVDDLVFEYQPDEIGLSEAFAAKVQAIKQIRPLDPHQPWSIYWIDFENKKLPLTVLRRILNAFVTKKRANNRNIATSEMEDIMFVSGHGENENRAITFAHFKRLEEVETIREFYWDGHETKFDHITSYLEKLEWPSNTADVEGWRQKWKVAFTGSTREAITTSDHLARAMANIARNICDRVLEVLEVEHTNGPVHKLYDTFRTSLVHDMTEKGFADMYAQTITYGLFSARTMDTDGHFELHEVIDLIPTTNPFLKNLFKECLSTSDKNHKIDLDELGVSRLVDLFDNLNRSDGTDAMQRILAEFGRQTFSGQEDPVIHFYEGFLKEYDNKERVEKGVYYTPDPVVKFIVHSVNEQLKSEFGLEYGLADTSTWAEMVASGRAEFPVDPNTGKINKEWTDKIKGRAFVQILDPATGTGTFLKHVIEIILEEEKLKFKKEQINGSWEDYWNSYVYNSLLPRIYGFELMMASYSVAHMKLGMFLKSTGYKFEKEQRLNIFLTNSLEPYTSNSTANLFFTSVGAESAGANEVKKNRYFSVVIGNPPYSGISKNKDPWITNLIDDYKYVDGVHFNERKHWLNADEIKFIRFGQELIKKNGIGILGFINPHGYIDNPTFRGMRNNLAKLFSNIYIIDLHGNANKQEKSPDGSLDDNVFDIQQGVAINLFVKTNNSISKFGNVLKYDLFGQREFKYHFLNNTKNSLISHIKINLNPPFYFFLPNNHDKYKKYSEWLGINDLLIINSTGVQTGNDALLMAESREELKNRIMLTYGFDLQDNYISQIAYRPFDIRQYFFLKSRSLNPTPVKIPLSYRSRFEVMKNFNHENYGLVISRQWRNSDSNQTWSNCFCVKEQAELALFVSANAGANIFPIYKYVQEGHFTTNQTFEKVSNFNPSIIKEIETRLNLSFSIDKTVDFVTFSSLDLFDYIYSVLHSPLYRSTFKEFLKTDFPRVPYPINKENFKKLVKLGGELRQIHLLKSSVVDNFITSFPEPGTNGLPKAPEYKNGRVYINKEQYFDDVPEVAWNFYIGGYQPAQKWLKDRKGRVLTEEDINHYQKIIVALTETDRIMKEIDKIDFMDN